MQILQVLVQLSHLRAQGAFDQYADLPPLCHQSAVSRSLPFRRPLTDGVPSPSLGRRHSLNNYGAFCAVGRRPFLC
jgi:hypothetical protein